MAALTVRFHFHSCKVLSILHVFSSDTETPSLSVLRLLRLLFPVICAITSWKICEFYAGQQEQKIFIDIYLYRDIPIGRLLPGAFYFSI